MTVEAIETYLDEPFLSCRNAGGRIHSVFARAVNLEFEIGAEKSLYTLTSDRGAGIPDSIVVAPGCVAAVRTAGCGAAARKAGHAVEVPSSPIGISLGRENRSNVFPPGCRFAPEEERERRARLIRGILASRGLRPCEPVPRQHAGAALLFAELAGVIARRSLADCERILPSILGLGPGLTPSADDALLGMLAVFSFFDAVEATPVEDRTFHASFASLVAAMAPGRTTEISGKYLRCAAQGRFSVPLIRAVRSFLDAGCPVDGEGILALSRTGGTSGMDMLAGIRAGSKYA